MKKQYPITALCACLLIGLLMYCGCGTKWQQRRCRALNCCPPAGDTITKTIHDTMWFETIKYVQPKDSATSKLLLRCDSLGNVYIYEAQYWQGKYVYLKSTLSNNTLNTTAVKPEAEDSAKVERKEHRESTTKKSVLYKEVNVLTTWEKIQVGSWWPLAAWFLVCIIYIAYRIYRRIKL